jgi:stage II sporulation protein D
MIAFLIFISCFQSSAETLRIRLNRDLSSFPNIKNAQFTQVKENFWSIKGNALSFQNIKIPEKSFVMKKTNQKFDVIAELDFETYLAGVVGSEMPASWPMEALKTQAVVARSFALARIKERAHQAYQLDADQMDQVFQNQISSRALVAVTQTKNIVLKNAQGKILKAFYHSDCGGQTVPASKVWPTEIDSGTAIDPWCQKRKLNEWSLVIPQDEFFAKLQSPQQNFIDVSDVFRGRIQAIQVNGFDVSIQKLRQIFGFAMIRNSPQKMTLENKLVQIRGKGFGHGAGLCQWGTLAQAKLGLTSLQILKHYYPLASISTSEKSLNLAANFK